MSTDLDPVATTSRITAAIRAAESARPDRLFDDPFADTLAGDVGRAIAARIDSGDVIPVRTRFDDDGLRAAVEDGVRQVVLVAAGMDTRAWRLPLPDGCTVFEVDRPELLALKASLLDGTAPAAHRAPVAVDLTADWTAALDRAGHDPARPTCWIVEGLLQYLPEPAVLALLDDVTGRSAAGSHLLTDVVGARLLASEQMRPLLDSMAAAGSPWVFGTDDPLALLAPRGWGGDARLLDDVAAELGRPPLSADPSDAPGWVVHLTR